MIHTDESSATVREFLAYRRPLSNSLYSMSGQNPSDLDDAFLETVEIMGNSREFYLQNQTLLMNE